MLITDLHSGDWYKIEIFKWYIIGYTKSKLIAMKELRQLFTISLDDTKRVINTLPLFLIETSELSDLIKWRDKLSNSHFEIKEQIEIRWQQV